MSLMRRVRGLVGTALTWGGMGLVAGVAVFIGVYRPWPLTADMFPRAIQLFLKWEAASFVWGVASGLSFGLVVLGLERTRRWSQLSRARITAWGAVAGGLFPTLLSIRPIMAGSSVTYFGLIIGASALAGAAWARASFAMARRVPDAREQDTFPLETAERMPDPAVSGRSRAT